MKFVEGKTQLLMRFQSEPNESHIHIYLESSPNEISAEASINHDEFSSFKFSIIFPSEEEEEETQIQFKTPFGNGQLYISYQNLAILVTVENETIFATNLDYKIDDDAIICNGTLKYLNHETLKVTAAGMATGRTVFVDIKALNKETLTSMMTFALNLESHDILSPKGHIKLKVSDLIHADIKLTSTRYSHFEIKGLVSLFGVKLREYSFQVGIGNSEDKLLAAHFKCPQGSHGFILNYHFISWTDFNVLVRLDHPFDKLQKN